MLNKLRNTFFISKVEKELFLYFKMNKNILRNKILVQCLDTYFDIIDTIDLKIDAMKKYTSELCEYLHPRSLKGIELNAKYQGVRVGKKYVEAFKSIRVIK